MDPLEGGTDRKKSKSDPTAAIVLPSEPEEVRARLDAAFCPAREVDGNPVVELVRYVAFPWEGRFRIPRPAKFGGEVAFETEAEFLESWRTGAVHPKDLKGAVAEMLERVMRPAAEYFRAHPGVGPSAFAAPPETAG